MAKPDKFHPAGEGEPFHIVGFIDGREMVECIYDGQAWSRSIRVDGDVWNTFAPSRSLAAVLRWMKNSGCTRTVIYASFEVK